MAEKQSAWQSVVGDRSGKVDGNQVELPTESWVRFTPTRKAESSDLELEVNSKDKMDETTRADKITKERSWFFVLLYVMVS